jgi:hypothetical protein
MWRGSVTAREVHLTLTQPPHCDSTVTVAALVPFGGRYRSGSTTSGDERYPSGCGVRR